MNGAPPLEQHIPRIAELMKEHFKSDEPIRVTPAERSSNRDALIHLVFPHRLWFASFFKRNIADSLRCSKVSGGCRLSVGNNAISSETLVFLAVHKPSANLIRGVHVFVRASSEHRDRLTAALLKEFPKARKPDADG